MYYRTRYYDPSAGRFMSSDSAGRCGGNNRYAYVRDNPANSVDPAGKWASHLFDGGSGDINNVLCVGVGSMGPRWELCYYAPPLSNCDQCKLIWPRICSAGLGAIFTIGGVCAEVCTPTIETGPPAAGCMAVCTVIILVMDLAYCQLSTDSACRTIGFCGT